MKKVLHLLASNKFSGAENVVCTIIDNFKDEIEMSYCSPDGLIRKTLEDKNISYFPLKKMSLGQIKKVIKKYQPDIIHAHDYTASVFAALSGFKGKIISHLHNNCPFAKNWNLKTILYNFTIPKYYKIIGVSDKVKEEAIFRKNIENKYFTIYNYVDSKSIIQKSNEYNEKKEYDLFFIGRLTEQKDPLKFIEIINKLHLKEKKVTAVMIGDGELRNECKNLIDSYKLNKYINMIGFVENPFPIIKNCKIGIMPSKWEGFGLTAIESMVLGKPVLNSGEGGLREIFANDKCYICNNIAEYIAKIISIMQNEMQEEFKNILLEYCDKEVWHNKLLNIYMEGK